MPSLPRLRSALVAAAIGLATVPAAFAADGVPVPVTQAGTVAQATAISAVLARFNALFATSIPLATNTELLDLFAPDFLDGGDTLATMLTADNLLGTDNLGLTLSLTKILNVASGGGSLLAALKITAADGTVENAEMQFVLGTDGKWRLWGDRRYGSIEPHAINMRQRSTSTSAWNYSRWVDFYVDNNAQAIVKYVRVSGPGLPDLRTFNRLGTVSGVVYGRNADGDFRLVETSLALTDSTMIPACGENQSPAGCIDLATAKASSRYSVVFYNSSYKRIGAITTLPIRALPYPNETAQSKANAWFATPRTFKPALRGSIVNGSAMSLTWALPISSTLWMETAGVYAGNDNTTMNVFKDSWNGVLGLRATSAAFGKWTGTGSPGYAGVWLQVGGANGRRFVSNQDWPY